MDKKLIKYLIILGVLIVAVIIISFLSNAITGGSKFSFEKLEEKVVAAARKYTKDKPGVVDGITPNTSYPVSVNFLTSQGYIGDLSEMTKDGSRCGGSVIIFKTIDGHVDYVPDLTCGKNSSIKLSSKIIEDNGGGTVSGSGLYEKVNGRFVTDYQSLTGTGEYVFRGDEVNNYVQIDDNLYRVVSIDEQGNILIIYTGYLQKSVAWDDRYNEDTKKNQGINDYEKNGLKSRAMENVEYFYNGSAILLNKEKYSSKTRNLLTTIDLCIGKRKETDTDISGRIECSTVLEDQKAGMLPAYYFMEASLDPNCRTITSRACGNYNYLSQFNDFWWLLTANADSTNEAYVINKRYAELSFCSAKSSIRPIIKLGSRVLYKDGTGTLDNPYTVKYFDD